MSAKNAGKSAKSVKMHPKFRAKLFWISQNPNRSQVSKRQLAESVQNV